MKAKGIIIVILLIVILIGGFWKNRPLSDFPIVFHRSNIETSSNNPKSLIETDTAYSDRPLKSLAQRHDLYIGAAVAVDKLQKDKEYAEILSEEFSLVTPENAMKFKATEPKKGKFDFSQGDRLVAFAQKNDMAVRGHTLVWDKSLPDWLMKKDDWTKEELTKVLENHIRKVVGHYKGKIVAWDVVNEAFNDDGSLKENIWLKTIGPDYIRLAFEAAHRADPQTKLFYNDFKAEERNAKSDAIYALLFKLKEDGVPIDGIGFESHLYLDKESGEVALDFDSMEENLARFEKAGFEIQITEADVTIRNASINYQKKLERQARAYQSLLSICLNKKACTAFVMWGFLDKYSWLNASGKKPADAPLIVDDSYYPKPAYNALSNYLLCFPKSSCF